MNTSESNNINIDFNKDTRLINFNSEQGRSTKAMQQENFNKT